jgi:hypothetical protein
VSVFRKMAQFGSPLKLLPSSAKRSKPSIDWNQCIICQCKSLEQLYVFTDKGKDTFIKAAEVRQDEVYRRLIEEVSSITHVVSESFVVKYHRSSCKSYTSKQNFPVRNNPTFNHLIHFCSENRLGSTVLFCLFDRALNVISIKDIDDNGCQLKTRDLILQNQVPSHQRF